MKKRPYLSITVLLISFVFLTTASIFANETESFSINETTSNLWDFVPTSGGSYDAVEGQLHYLSGETGYLFFVGSDEELEYLKELRSELIQLYPDSRIIPLESVIPFTYLNLMSNGDIVPERTDFIDVETKTVIAAWDFETGFWAYYNESDNDGNRFMLTSNGEATLIDDSELAVYKNTPYDDLIEYIPAGTATLALASVVGSSEPTEWKPNTRLGKRAQKVKLPKNWAEQVEQLKDWAAKQPKNKPRTKLGMRAAKVKLPGNWDEQVKKLKEWAKKNSKPHSHTGLGKAVLNPKVSADLDKAIRRARLKSRIIGWGTVGVIVGGYGTLGVMAYLKNRTYKKRKQAIKEENEKLKTQDTEVDSLNDANKEGIKEK